MPRPLSEAGRYARSLGLTTEQVHRLGGMERVRAMPEDGRAILVGDVKRQTARQRRGKGLSGATQPTESSSPQTTATAGPPDR